MKRKIKASRSVGSGTVVSRVAISVAQAEAFARLALAGLDREYPNKPNEVMAGAGDILSPRAMHPAFFGCFDWHSSVHAHWMLARLLRMFPGMARAAEVRARLDAHFTWGNLASEAAYFDRPGNRSFERPYGWAWLLRLALELKTWSDAEAHRWHGNLAPLEQKVVLLAKAYLAKLTYPVRTGVHPDTAFAMGQFLDYARGVGDRDFERLLLRCARAFYAHDTGYPEGYEPSGEDFFSAGLNEADLMRRILPQARFVAWWNRFAPDAFVRSGGSWSRPAKVADVSDPKFTHLVGLNLSRAWTLQGILSALPADDGRRKALVRAMDAHARAGLRRVFSGHYEGEHWLATFAVYYLGSAGMVA